jgi:hypothetical protein
MHPVVALVIGVVVGALIATAIIFVRKLTKTTRQLPQGYQTSFIYSGNLKQTSIVDAIQLLEIGKREGVLHIFHGRRKGYIVFSKGTVIDAFYRNATGRDAIFSMMELPEGDFYFESKEIAQPRLITDSVMDLVMMFEGRRFEQFASEPRDGSQLQFGMEAQDDASQQVASEAAADSQQSTVSESQGTAQQVPASESGDAARRPAESEQDNPFGGEQEWEPSAYLVEDDDDSEQQQSDAERES